MANQLRPKRSVVKEMARLHPTVRERVMDVFKALPDDPYPENSKQLQGHAIFAIRVGDYRILYEVDEDVRLIVILRVRHRREFYRDL